MHKTNLSLARAKTLLSGLVISQLGLGRAVLDDASSHVLESSFSELSEAYFVSDIFPTQRS